MITKWNLWTAVTAVGLFYSQFYSPGVMASNKGRSFSADPFVRVRLMSLKHQVNLSGMAISIQGQKSKFLPVSLPRQREFDVSFRRVEQNIQWQIREPEGSTKQVLGSPLALEGDFLRVGRQLAPSRLLLFARPKQVVDVIAVIDIEQYLLGVLAGEMPASWPLEALKAQAVASRSYALFNRQQKTHGRFHLESTIHDQVFDFQGSRLLSKSLKEKIRKAVDETRGQVLFTENGKILQSFYHADCGGQTAPTHEIWGDRNPIQSVKDPFCPSTPYRVWRHRVRTTEFMQRLGLPGRTLNALKVVSHTTSRRVNELEVYFDGKRAKRISAHQMRHRLGTSKVKSTRFAISKKGAWVELSGSGYGHGVGLCQWGSRSRALSGQSYKTILAHYYPGSELVRWTDSDLRLAKESSRHLFSMAPEKDRSNTAPSGRLSL